MSILGKIFGNDDPSHDISVGKTADGMATAYELSEHDYLYVDETPIDVAIKHVTSMSVSKKPLTNRQVDYITAFSKHVDASREKKGQILYEPKPKF